MVETSGERPFTAALVRHGVDSPMESRLRLLIVLAGLPEPEVGRTVYDADGGWLIRRRENLERVGWLVRVITAADVLRAPETVVARIAQDLRARNHPYLFAA